MSGTAEDFAAATAKDAVDEGVLNESEVDFIWVIRGFLSYYFPTNHGWKGESDIVLAVRFLLPCPIFISTLTPSVMYWQIS
jgi:hypothetical protein